jgi:hypothetical protein
MGEISGVLQSGASAAVGSVRSTTFLGCHVLGGPDPRYRARLHSGSIEKCKHNGCWIAGALVEDLIVQDLTSAGSLGAWLKGCIFSRVTLRGRIKGVTWQDEVSEDPELNRIYQVDAHRRYAALDWALDISEADFPDLTVLDGVPPTLVRRAPTRHFLLSPDNAQAARSASSTLVVVAKIAGSSPNGVVFAPGSKSDRDKRRLDECYELRDKGLLD